MQVKLDPEIERRLHGKVESGVYKTLDEAVQWAVWLLLQEDEEWERQRAAFNRGLGEAMAEADAGDFVDGPAFFRSFRARIAAE